MNVNRGGSRICNWGRGGTRQHRSRVPKARGSRRRRHRGNRGAKGAEGGWVWGGGGGCAPPQKIFVKLSYKWWVLLHSECYIFLHFNCPYYMQKLVLFGLKTCSCTCLHKRNTFNSSTAVIIGCLLTFGNVTCLKIVLGLQILQYKAQSAGSCHLSPRCSIFIAKITWGFGGGYVPLPPLDPPLNVNYIYSTRQDSDTASFIMPSGMLGLGLMASCLSLLTFSLK